MVASLVITRTQVRFYLAARRVVNVFPLRPLGSVRVPRVAFGVAPKTSSQQVRTYLGSREQEGLRLAKAFGVASTRRKRA